MLVSWLQIFKLAYENDEVNNRTNGLLLAQQYIALLSYYM
jgi:hypothetical protein